MPETLGACPQLGQQDLKYARLRLFFVKTSVSCKFVEEIVQRLGNLVIRYAITSLDARLEIVYEAVSVDLAPVCHLREPSRYNFVIYLDLVASAENDPHGFEHLDLGKAG